MAFKIAEAFVTIEVDKGKFSTNIRAAKRETNNFGKAATKSVNRVSSSLRTLGLIAGAVAAVAIGKKLVGAFVRAGKEAIIAAVKYDRLKIGLKAVAGSSAEAERQLIRLEKVAKLPGLSFEGAIAGSTALQAAGLNAELAERSLLAFGNALVTVGKGADDLKGVNLALTQIVTKSTGFGQELRQLAERLPQVRKAMKDAFGIGSVQDFKKLGLSAEEFIEGIVVEFEKLPKVTGTIANDLENLGIAFDRLKDEIGKTMLGITSDVSKQLTSIVDNLRLIVDNYGIFRGEAIKVMLSVTVIGVRAATVMMKGIGRIIVATSPLIFEPLKNAAGNTFRDILAGAVILFNALQKKIGLIDLKTFEDTLTDAVRKNQKLNKEAAEDFEKKFDAAAESAAVSFERELPRIAEALVDALVQIDAEFEKLAKRARMLDQFKAGLRELADSLLGIFQPFQTESERLLANLRKTMGKGDFEFLTLKREKTDFLRNAEIIEGAAKRIASANADRAKATDEFAKKRQEINLERFRTFLEEQREAAERIANAISPVFENMFENFFQGNTKNLWEQFFSDLKRTAIRQLAGIFATQLLAGLLTGGASFGLTGAGLLAGLGPIAAPGGQPRTAGRGIAAGARAVGGFLEGGTINIMDQDLQNFDQQRLTRQVEQGIVPAFNRAAADGI